MFNVCKIISHENICVLLKHKHKSISTTAQIFPTSHKQQAANLALLFVARSADLDRGQQIGGPKQTLSGSSPATDHNMESGMVWNYFIFTNTVL